MSSINFTNFTGNPIFNTTGAVRLPVGTTAERPANPVVGMVRYNTDLYGMEVYTGASTGWLGFGNTASPFTATFVSLFTSPSRTAPTSVGSFYNSTNLSGQISLDGGKQIWTVPSTGIWRFDAYGAQGGCNANYRGGGGARIRGDFYLEQGQVLEILCGSTGAYNSKEDCDSGGGGGTYVVKRNAINQGDVLVIAAGGGGASYPESGTPAGGGDRSNPTGLGNGGKDGQAGTDGVTGAAGRAGLNGTAGDRSLSGSARGNPGGGFYSGGNSGSSNPTWGETTAGFSYKDGANGGTPNDADSFGGFGGGGGGHGNCYISGGGGGGWNGGGCQIQYSTRHGGCGGGSLNNGLNQINTSGANYDASGSGAMGRVVVTKVGGV